jgi:glycosyltransferase involved in cell wall biosynthesis
MAAGLPVLASDRTYAALDRVVPGVSGVIHAAGDSASLARHCETLLLNPKKRVAMGVAARETALQWPLDRAATMFREILQQSEPVK